MIKVIQANINNSRAAFDLLIHTARERGVDLLVVSECGKTKHPNMVKSRTGRVALIGTSESATINKVNSGRNYVWADIDGVVVCGCYFPPNDTIETFGDDLDELIKDLRGRGKSFVVAGDLNAASTVWGCEKTNKRGNMVEEMAAVMDLMVVNEGNAHTFERGESRSIIDITLASGGSTNFNVRNWKVENEETLSDHKYISFNIDSAKPRPPKDQNKKGWNIKKINEEKLRERMGSEHRPTTPSELDALLRKLADHSMRYTRAGRRGLHQNDLEAEDLAASRKQLRRAIGNRKKECWRELCDELEKDVWGKAYKIVVGKMGLRERAIGLDSEVQEQIHELFPLRERITRQRTEDDQDSFRKIEEEELKEAVKKRGKPQDRTAFHRSLSRWWQSKPPRYLYPLLRRQ
ncbi:uncharacterized protein LOC116163131 [Photinus pyralis]|uniref:uncharacterized protein LOC116163131 n=1 Tax=Photinus pyralis TaxID=7054 RepID=UPI00126772D4|nr:uncharacterized protein LOC116163131 [Photinus pyralis]